MRLGHSFRVAVNDEVCPDPAGRQVAKFPLRQLVWRRYSANDGLLRRILRCNNTLRLRSLRSVKFERCLFLVKTAASPPNLLQSLFIEAPRAPAWNSFITKFVLTFLSLSIAFRAMLFATIFMIYVPPSFSQQFTNRSGHSRCAVDFLLNMA